MLAWLSAANAQKQQPCDDAKWEIQWFRAERTSWRTAFAAPGIRFRSRGSFFCSSPCGSSGFASKVCFLRNVRHQLTRLSLGAIPPSAPSTSDLFTKMRSLWLAAATLMGLWTCPISASSSSSSASSIASGNEVVDIQVGCGASTVYPANTSASEPAFSYNISNSVAEFIALNFSSFNLPADDYVKLRPTYPNSTETKTFSYYGNSTNFTFMSNALFTQDITIELYTTGNPTPNNPLLCTGFQIVNYRYLAQAAMNTNSSGHEEICGADQTQEAACFKATFATAFTRSNAVIRLLIHKSTGSYFCTGWLLGSQGHVITNNHCISLQSHASDTEFEFMAEGPNCETSCATAMGCPGTVRATTSTLITTSVTLDYTLVLLTSNPTTDYGYLQLRTTGAVLNERIYIPQHPAGWGKRIAMKTDAGWGSVLSLTSTGCTSNQVAYALDTQGGSSGSPVISFDDNSVVALHHCGGCPYNTAINSEFLYADMISLNVLPEDAIYVASTPAPTTQALTSAPTTQAPTSAPTSAPTTQAPTPAPTPAPTTQTPSTVQAKIDGTIISTATSTSVDYIDFTLTQKANVVLDILSMEAVTSDRTTTYTDVNNDCNAGYLDTAIVLFKFNDAGTVTTSTVVATNNDAPSGYGSNDGSISQSDSFMYLPLTQGKYRLAVGASSLTPELALAKVTAISTTLRVCNSAISNYGSYRLTISTNIAVQATSPGSYIGSQCSYAATTSPYSKCPYHKEAVLSNTATMDGTIKRSSSAVSVDYIPFKVSTFGRVNIEVSSYESRDGCQFLNVNGNCESAYIDPVAYLFRANTNGLTTSDLINADDDDENFARRSGRHSVSFRDPFFSLGLPMGNYVLVVGRYPLSLAEAIQKSSTSSVSKFTPETCGTANDHGNYLVTFGSPQNLSPTSPNSYSGTKCAALTSSVMCSLP